MHKDVHASFLGLALVLLGSLVDMEHCNSDAVVVGNMDNGLGMGTDMEQHLEAERQSLVVRSVILLCPCHFLDHDA